MCYIVEIDDKVGIRELRQNLTKYLRRVVAGETLRVTDRGTPVAVLAPLPEQATTLDRLAARGLVTRAGLDLQSLGVPQGAEVTVAISDALDEQRAEAEAPVDDPLDGSVAP